MEIMNNDGNIPQEHIQLSVPLPQDVIEQLAQDTIQAGGEWSEPVEYHGAIGRTMFDLPNSEDNTITVLLPKDAIHAAPSQALVRIHSVQDNDDRYYLGIVVKGPFAEPDGLRGDAPIMITTAVRGGIFMPRYHGRVQVELLGEELGKSRKPEKSEESDDPENTEESEKSGEPEESEEAEQSGGVLIPPRLRPLPNSPVFVLSIDETARTLHLDGDIPLGVPVGYEQITASIPSDKKSVLPRHLGILGTTGGGKSTTVSSLISGFQQADIATIVLDTEGEYTEIYQPTNDATMLTALAKRDKTAAGVNNVTVYHLVGRETTCPDRKRTRAFSLQFSRLSPYLVMGMLEMNDAQQQRYQKAYDIAKRMLWDMQIFPTTQDEKTQVLELDEMETGYPKMTVQHMYDVVRACAEIAANEKVPDDFASPDYRFYSPQFEQHRVRFSNIFKRENLEQITHPTSWRVVQGKLGQLVRWKIFDQSGVHPLVYKHLAQPGKVSIIDLSDTDSPQVNNLVIAEFLRGLLEAQNENYREAVQNNTSQCRTMIIIEEAHEFLSSERI
ncbi:MAG TPA: helicase HerA-like domain-containing protein, partial [Ktedonobacteraceae bacterium]|nr:helicase HerA-like domain-containing protein [Ktedonobacteraceae bacterium]